jgi:hypothetical protein
MTRMRLNLNIKDDQQGNVRLLVFKCINIAFRGFLNKLLIKAPDGVACLGRAIAHELPFDERPKNQGKTWQHQLSLPQDLPRRKPSLSPQLVTSQNADRSTLPGKT